MANLIGQSLGRYHIFEQLGEGGMATVYKAYDTLLETDVAVKVIRTEKLTEETRERSLKRFEREAKSLARLTHPNIVKVTDYGEYEGKPFLVMPYLPGGTLKSKLSGKPMPWQEAIRLLIPIADALGYAHKHDVIHRDIKPSNILITENGQPMLSDFGVAKLLDAEETMDLTGTGVGVGTPEYMAPEQGNSKTVDHRADIYALGVVFYEMVTGRKPFIADTPLAVLIKSASEPLPRPKQFAPDLPQAVENVLFKALAKEPKDRYQNMGEFTDALEGLITGKAMGNKYVTQKTKEDPVHVKEKHIQIMLPSFLLRTAITVGLIVVGIGLLAVLFKSLSVLPAQLFATSMPSNTPTPIFTSTPKITPTPIFTSTSISYPDEITDEKGVRMRLIPAGEFSMGSNDGGSDEKPVHTVNLDAFYLDKYEVTNALYEACVNVGNCGAPRDTSSATRSSYYDNSEFDNYPVIHVDWNMANAYCEWRGANLPSEAQWEKAARGTDGRTYPWGENIDCDKANYQRSCVGDTTKVGSYESGKSLYGIYDMAGNVWELVNDWYSNTYYQSLPSLNPLGPDFGGTRVLRGGSWLDGGINARSARRHKVTPDYFVYTVSFRCARMLP